MNELLGEVGGETGRMVAETVLSASRKATMQVKTSYNRAEGQSVPPEPHEARMAR